jgi:hypothetical protein
MANLSFSGVSMIRVFVVACALSCMATSVWAQTQPAPGTAATQTATQAKPAAKKPPPKAKAAVKPPATDDGRCDLGVIPAAGVPIGLKTVGLTMFGNEYSEVPSDAWGIDDLIVARVRAAAGAGIVVRRIAVGKEALFDLYQKPGKGLFNNPRENLRAVIRQITASSPCARYIVFTRFAGALAGTNQSLDGIGVLTQGPFGKAAVFAYVHVTVFDGQTLAIRDDPFGGFGARLSASLSALAKDEFIRTAQGAEFPASPEAAARDPKLRDSARALLAERLDRILPEYLKE